MCSDFSKFVVILASLMVGSLLFGCGSSTHEMAATRDDSSPLEARSVGLPPRPGRPSAPGVEVTPVSGQPTGNGELQTVQPITLATAGWVIACDTNSATAHAATGLRPPRFEVSGVYLPAYEPTLAVGQGFGALTRAAATWDAVSVEENELDVLLTSATPNVWAPPGRDAYNVVGWCRFVQPTTTAPTYAGALFTWHDAQGNVLEWDLFLNLCVDWAVNPAIQPGATATGQFIDMQSVITHELGHLLGLGDVTAGSGALTTMASGIRVGELNKQTLSSGDRSGLQSIWSRD